MRRLKIKSRLLALSSLCMIAPMGAGAQTMSLHECVEYAVSHNLSIKQQELSVQNQELQLETSRYSRLPDLNASLGQDLGFGRSSDRYGATVDRTATSTSLSVSANMPLFTGFRIPNQIKADRYSLQATTENLEQARRSISISVATYYLQALYYKGLVDVQRQQLELDEESLVQARSLVDAGRRPESEVASAQAQVDMSRKSLVEAEGNEVLARLDLMQALNLQGDVASFQINDLDTTALSLDVTPADVVFAQAVEQHPSILAAKYKLESSRAQQKVAQSRMLPSLSLYASYRNSLYHDFDGMNTPASRQLNLNGSEGIGLSLSIPIFNRFATRNSVRQSRLQISSQEFALDEARQTLNKEIQQAYWNATKSRQSYEASLSAEASTILAYRYEADRFASGRGVSYELQQARTKMIRAMQDKLQARYEYLMRVKILEFYQGGQM